MIRERIIPIDRISKGSRVILYGAGKNGKKYWQQNSLIGWCEICMVVDTYYNNVTDFPVQVEMPEKIRVVKDYDYILISIVTEGPRKEAIKILMDMGIDRKVIIDSVSCFYEQESDVIAFIEEKEADDSIKIAFLPSGMMGDNIISLKLYQELVRLAPMGVIDVFTPLKGVPEKVFYAQNNLHEIKSRGLERKEWNQYDLVIESNFEPVLLYCNIVKIERLCSDLAEHIKILYEYQKRDGIDLPVQQFTNRMRLDRARFMGWNRYTLLGCSNAFDIRDQYTDFYINSEYEKQYLKLNLHKPYITYHFGTSDPLKNGKLQTKVWPYEFHEQLNKLLTERFPEINLVQLGEKDMQCVPGADHYIQGEDLETVKYILKNALFHFDCESGLVHMATQLGTKCFVVFGPTPIWFMGYDRNVNIAPKVCGECKGLIKDWYTRCYKYEKPECMYSITPEYVFGLMEKYLIEHGF